MTAMMSDLSGRNVGRKAYGRVPRLGVMLRGLAGPSSARSEPTDCPGCRWWPAMRPHPGPSRPARSRRTTSRSITWAMGIIRRSELAPPPTPYPYARAVFARPSGAPEEGVSIRELARRHQVHRRAVRQALAAAIPPPRKAVESRPQPAIGPHAATIRQWLTERRTPPPVQPTVLTPGRWRSRTCSRRSRSRQDRSAIDFARASRVLSRSKRPRRSLCLAVLGRYSPSKSSSQLTGSAPRNPRPA